MSNAAQHPATPSSETSARAPQHARELQARLYREIGISAVAAALRYAAQPELPKAATAPRDMPAILRDAHKAA